VLLVGLWLTAPTPALLWVALLLGLLIVVLTILEVVDPLDRPGHPVVVGRARRLRLLHELYGVRYMVIDRFVTIDELWATGATFTVVA
jgi:hypothetical protein